MYTYVKSYVCQKKSTIDSINSQSFVIQYLNYPHFSITKRNKVRETMKYNEIFKVT